MLRGGPIAGSTSYWTEEAIARDGKCFQCGAHIILGDLVMPLNGRLSEIENNGNWVHLSCVQDAGIHLPNTYRGYKHWLNNGRLPE